MIITKTPFRMSFLGGGSDLPEFYKQHPGKTLSATINKYMYISSHDFFEKNQIRVKYSKTETVDNIENLEHPILKNVMQKLKIAGGIEVSSIADIPSGTGLGSSSCFTVGLLQNLYARMGRFVTKEEIAHQACEVEIKDLKEPIGKQDQYAAAYGGINVITYSSNETVQVEPIYLKPEIQTLFSNHLLLFYTGQTRSASKVLAEQKKNMLSQDKVNQLKKMVNLVESGRKALLGGQIDQFGDLLHQSWVMKKELAKGITNPQIEAAYDKSMQLGAYGGKVLGAGGGGFILICCNPSKREEITQSLVKLGLDQRDFSFEFDGSKVIYAE